MNKKLNEYIVSLIGNRPIKSNEQKDLLLYLKDIQEPFTKELFYRTLKTGLYIPVITTEANPSYDQIKVDLLAVLVDCFTDEIAHLIVGEMQLHELCGCLEEREVLVCYYTKDTSALQQAINRLLEKVETAVLWSEAF